jgi:hypothetical protein
LFETKGASKEDFVKATAVINTEIYWSEALRN